MVAVTIGIGSNCGDREALVSRALDWLKGILMQTKCSDIYETPCAMKKGRPYKNAVIQGYFSGDGFKLDEMLKDKEREMGRTTECRERGDVPIDIDIVICDGEILKPWDYRQKFFRIGFSQIN